MPAKGVPLPPATSSFDVAIVGGGIIGLAVALRTRQKGLSVTVLERGEPGRGATHVAAGMLAPTSEAAFGEEALLAANLESARRWPAFADELGVPLHRRGALMVARDRDEAEALERELAYRRELGLAVERLRPSEARRRERALAPTLRLALEVPDDHAVDPRAVVVALRVAVQDAGAELRAGAEVARLALPGGLELRGGERVGAERVVVAAGCWSGAIEGIPAAARVPVRPVKGQLLRLRDPAGPGLVERVIRMLTGYLVPRDDGRYVLGATVEERGFDTSVTAGAVYELLRDAQELIPGVAELELEAAIAGLRPGTPDNAPAVGPAEGIPGLVWATGHYRHGVLLAPLTADTVAAMLAGEAPPAAAAALDPARFARVPEAVGR